MAAPSEQPASKSRWNPFARRKGVTNDDSSTDEKQSRSTWNMGMLNDKETIEVPGKRICSVLLLAKDHNEPLGLRNAPARTSHSSLPTGFFQEPPTPTPPAAPAAETAEAAAAAAAEEDKKMTSDGQIILEPQPDDSHNDPLNWPSWRRDSALLSLGLYCMVGGGVTPILAAGFTDVAHDYDVEVAEVALTTGLYMLGLGIGSVVFSPTAILYGKRPVYLFGAVLFILSAVWCALSPNFTSLLLARIFQGIAVSPVECLPSATIAEIFFLHERAFRIGIYTLLLLGGKNLVPLVSAAIIESLDWRWVFWILAIVVGVSGTLLFLFVPETFWDRSPIPRSRKAPKRPSIWSRRSSAKHVPTVARQKDEQARVGDQQKSGGLQEKADESHHEAEKQATPHRPKKVHIGFASVVGDEATADSKEARDGPETPAIGDDDEIRPAPNSGPESTGTTQPIVHVSTPSPTRPAMGRARSSWSVVSRGTSEKAGVTAPATPDLHNFNSPYYKGIPTGDYFRNPQGQPGQHSPGHLTPGNVTPGHLTPGHLTPGHLTPGHIGSDTDSERAISFANLAVATRGQVYTHALRQAPPKSFVQQLKLHHGRLNQDRWWKAAIRPFILFSYPSVLWSAAVYSCSVGWLIVLSENVAVIYRDGSYEFSALSTGLVYISPFIGGVLGTAVAGRVSDVIVKAMARKNGGLYEPEFRLVMAIPVAITTVIGLMGFGWSAGVDDPWIVPTVFFGIVSFGCSLGSTTAITFCVDSYRQYAGEALVTLNFSKNIFHGLVFSLFVTEWLTADGSKSVYIWIGIIQLIVLLSTIPMYVYGKRARMWTVRKNFMEKF
ncbi:MFS general substrate transporter [Xylariomycetidae sp. FL0641]|nr:MFS general substrate transporter [Xylariomycetidae sp. FL0641]